MIKKLWQMFFLQGMETIIGGFALIIFYLMKDSPVPIISYFAVTLIGSILFFYLLLKYEEKAKLLYFLIVLPFILVGGHILNLPLYITLPISLFVLIRGISHYQDSQKQTESQWLLLSFLIGVLLLLLTSGKSGHQVIYYLLFLQLGFTLIGGFINRWITLEIDHADKKQLIKSYIGTMGTIVLFGVLVSAGLGIFRTVFIGVMKGLTWLIGWMLAPLLFWAEGKELKSNMNKNPNAAPEKPISELYKEAKPHEFIDLSTLIIFLAFILIVGIFIYFIKRENIVNERLSEKKQGLPFVLNSSSIAPNELNRIRRDLKAPSNIIRKQVYDLERYANKLHIGRQGHETFSDWMERLGIKDTLFLNSLYEKVRYGNEIQDADLEKRFIQDLKNKKAQLKVIQKQLVESGELSLETKHFWKRNNKGSDFNLDHH